MKLIIQIPCYNEEKTLSKVLKDLPKKVTGVQRIEVQVIDDGSTDKTLEVAKKMRVKHLVRFERNRGLAAAFKAGVDNAYLVGADILVNTDGDNQYKGADIKKLVKPIVEGSADVVVGCRPIDKHPEFSELKKRLQKLGSWVMRLVSKTEVDDASSGFRAYNREALARMNVFSDFSYVLETLIQAGYNNLRVVSVPIGVNKKTRESRLFKSLPQYLWNSAMTIVNIFIVYWSQRFFSLVAAGLLVVAMGLVVRFLYRITFLGSVAGTFWPTVVLAGILFLASFQVYLTGLLAAQISSNRKLSEELMYMFKKEYWEGKKVRRRKPRAKNRKRG